MKRYVSSYFKGRRGKYIADRGSSGKEVKMLEIFEVGPCENAFQMGFLIGRRFSHLIKSRLAKDLILQDQLLPFASSPQSQHLIRLLSEANSKKYPSYWDELLGMAEGSGVPVLQVSLTDFALFVLQFSFIYLLFFPVQIILLNFRKEILPFVANKMEITWNADDDCSDVLVVSDSMAIAAHNEDANVALVDHTCVFFAFTWFMFFFF